MRAERTALEAVGGEWFFEGVCCCGAMPHVMRERYLRIGFTFRIAKYFKAADTMRLGGWYRYRGG